MKFGFKSGTHLKSQYILEIRVVSESDELLERVSGYHALLFLEDGETFRLSTVVAQKLVQFFGNDRRTVLPTQLGTGGLQEVGLAEAQGGFLHNFYEI